MLLIAEARDDNELAQQSIRKLEKAEAQALEDMKKTLRMEKVCAYKVANDMGSTGQGLLRPVTPRRVKSKPMAEMRAKENKADKKTPGLG